MKDSSRRSFVKTSAATGLTFTFAGLIRAHGQSGGGNTTFIGTYSTNYATSFFGTYSSTIAEVTMGTYSTTIPETTMGTFSTTEYETTGSKISQKKQMRFRLICHQAPKTVVGQISWNESLTAQTIANATPNIVKVEAITSPDRGDIHVNKMTISARWTSTLGPNVAPPVPLVTKSSDTCLFMPKPGTPLYNGSWLVIDEDPPYKEAKEYLDSPGDLPLTGIGPSLGFTVKGQQVDASVVKSGYFIGGLNVTGGENVHTIRKTTTSEGQVQQYASEAAFNLASPELTLGGGVSPKSITAEIDIKNKSTANISTSGNNKVTKEYTSGNNDDTNTTFTFSGQCTSSMNSTIAMDWKIGVQSQTREVVYIDGKMSHVVAGSETEWLPPLEEEQTE